VILPIPALKWPGLSAGRNRLSGLKDYEGIASTNIETFTSDLDATVLAFQTYANKYQTDGLKAAGLYAETAGKIVGVIKPGVEGFNGLANYKSVAAGKLALFEADIDQLIRDFTVMAATYKPKALESGKAWADSVGGIATGLNNGAQLFTALQTYKSVPSTTITLFINDLELTVRLAGEMVKRTDKDLLPQMKLFTEATGGLFSELSGAMTLFKGLTDDKYKSVPSTTIQAFVDEIELTIKIADQLAQKTDTDMLDRVDDYSKAIGAIFDRFKKVSDVFTDITKFKDDPAKMVDTMMVGVKTAIDKMPGAKNQADEFYRKVDAWAGELELAARRAQEGLAAANNAVNIVNGGGGSSGPDFSNWQPSVGAATQSLSDTASAPLLNAGLSMPAPVVSNSSSSVTVQGNVMVSLPNVQAPLNQAQANQVASMINGAIKEQAGKL
jgi:hypothetical protein